MNTAKIGAVFFRDGRMGVGRQWKAMRGAVVQDMGWVASGITGWDNCMIASDYGIVEASSIDEGVTLVALAMSVSWRCKKETGYQVNYLCKKCFQRMY